MPLAEDRDGVLSAFRGLQREKPPSKTLSHAGAVAEEILSELNLSETSPLDTIIGHWDEFIPPRLAGLSEPVDMSSTELYVRVLNSAAKQELFFEERKILAKLKKLTGCSKIRKIKFS